MNPDNACPGRDASPGDPHIYHEGICVFCLNHEPSKEEKEEP